MSLAEKVKTHRILESLTPAPRREKYEKAKEKAVYVRKNKREKAKKAPQDVPRFTNDSSIMKYILQYTSQFITLFF